LFLDGAFLAHAFGLVVVLKESRECIVIFVA
jgi:hypothetical protein